MTPVERALRLEILLTRIALLEAELKYHQLLAQTIVGISLRRSAPPAGDDKTAHLRGSPHPTPPSQEKQ